MPVDVAEGGLQSCQTARPPLLALAPVTVYRLPNQGALGAVRVSKPSAKKLSFTPTGASAFHQPEIAKEGLA
jgi:hypothetical protein